MIAVSKTTMSVFHRVKKADAAPRPAATVDPMEVCLHCWKVWMDRGDTDLGPKGMRLLAGDGDGYGNDDTAQARRDNEIAQATDAMINSLSAAQRWAIYRQSGIASVWRFPNLDYLATALIAKEELEKKLRGNIATATLFM